MRKHLSLEEKLDRLGELDPESPETSIELAKNLGAKSHLLAARAAHMAARFRLQDLKPNLLDAFEYFTLHADVDKGCAAKTAMVEALRLVEHREADVYLRAARHIQLEPVWGGRQDTAGPLRAAGVLGLALTGDSRLLETAVDLLADPAPEARAAAVRALAGSGSPSAPLLLRLKARVGDKRAEVTGECLTALLWLDWRHSLPLALETVDGPDAEAAEAAALAIGEAKVPEGFEALRARLADSPIRGTLLMAIALLRSDEALAFLRERAAARDRDAAAALKLYDNPAR